MEALLLEKVKEKFIPKLLNAPSKLVSVFYNVYY